MCAPSTRLSASVVSSSFGSGGCRSAVRSRTATPASRRRRTDARLELARAGEQLVGHLRADGAGAEHGDADGLGTGVHAVASSGEARVAGEQVGQGLAGDEHALRSVGHRDHGGSGDQVVVAGEAVVVRAGGGHGEQVAAAGVGRQVVRLDDDVARLAVLADDPHEHGVGRGDAVREAHLVLRAVEGGAGVVAHAAVDGDVAADRGALVRLQLDVLDRACRVDGRRRPDRRSSGRARSRGPGRGCRARRRSRRPCRRSRPRAPRSRPPPGRRV